MSDPLELLRGIYPRLENGDKKTLSTAVAAINEQLAELADLRSSLDRQPLPEAPASMTAKVVHADTQIEWLVTVREARAARLLISAMPMINEVLAEQGLIAMDIYIDSRRVERQESKALPAPAGTTSPAKNQLPADALTFKAENLVKSTEGDKTYYKVKGGKFAQYGVTIWPEALAEAGFDLDTLTGVTPLTGYMAHYILNDKGKPAKVVGLELA